MRVAQAKTELTESWLQGQLVETHGEPRYALCVAANIAYLGSPRSRRRNVPTASPKTDEVLSTITQQQFCAFIADHEGRSLGMT